MIFSLVCLHTMIPRLNFLSEPLNYAKYRAKNDSYVFAARPYKNHILNAILTIPFRL